MGCCVTTSCKTSKFHKIQKQAYLPDLEKAVESRIVDVSSEFLTHVHYNKGLILEFSLLVYMSLCSGNSGAGTSLHIDMAPTLIGYQL